MDSAVLELLRLRDESPLLDKDPRAADSHAVQAFAWHPHINRFAVALRDGAPLSQGID
jgi:hypothetical protein